MIYKFVTFVFMETSDIIIEKVAPIFNKKGYVGTRLSDITKAVNLTKGAIYCNFKNKEELAIKAFKFNLNRVIAPLVKKIEKAKTNKDKLIAIIEYYKTYYKLSKQIGGCPVLKVGNDAKYNNPVLFQEAKNVSTQLVKNLEGILIQGKKSGEFIEPIAYKTLAKNIFSMIEGGLFMAMTFDDESYLLDILTYIETNTIKSLYKR